MTRMFLSSRRGGESGFALVIIATLFIAFAVAAAAIMDHTNATEQLKQREATEAQLSRLTSALVQYYLFNGSYPCPASYGVVATDGTFGNPVDTFTVCQAATIPAGSGVDLLAPGGATNSLRGMVPVRALLPYGIDPNDAFDNWDNRVMYIVDRNLATGGSGTAAVAANRASVTEYNTGQLFRSPDFIVLSYGRDGLGAIPRTQTSVVVLCPAGGVLLRQTNCGSSGAFVQGPTFTPPNASSNVYFDDMLSFYGK